MNGNLEVAVGVSWQERIGHCQLNCGTDDKLFDGS